MAKRKGKVAKKQKNNAVMNDINGLHACISKDQDQLEKLYKKSCIAANKAVLTIQKSLAKAKNKSIKAKRNKTSAPKVYQSVLLEIQSLQKQLDTVKGEWSSIEAGYTKFNAQQKALFKFEKEWHKKSVNVKKKPKKQPNKMVIETAAAEAAQVL